jgi:type II secretory pathway pseudopilin PulG
MSSLRPRFRASAIPVFRDRLARLRPLPAARRGISGFTIVEVMVAAVVLVLGIVTAITTLQRGFQALDTARHYTFASQAMQSELERLRLKNWAQLQTLQDSRDTTVVVPAVAGADAGAFACTRVINDLKTDMKEIVLISTWRGYDGRPHTLRLVTRYSKSGLYDYFYTSH